MAFALTRFQAYGMYVDEAITKKAVQHAELTITALAADVDLDVGTDAGTFWTAAIANGTYGDIATEALAALVEIVARSQKLMGFDMDTLIDRIQVASASGTGYEVAVANERIEIVFAAANGETSHKLHMRWLLDDGVTPVKSDLG